MERSAIVNGIWATILKRRVFQSYFCFGELILKTTLKIHGRGERQEMRKIISSFVYQVPIMCQSLGTKMINNSLAREIVMTFTRLGKLEL